MSKNKNAADFLPQRVMIMPVVFRFARGLTPENFLWSGRDDEGNQNRELSRFVTDTYPGMHRAEDVSEEEPPQRTGVSSAPSSGRQPKTQQSNTTFAKAAAASKDEEEYEEEGNDYAE